MRSITLQSHFNLTQSKFKNPTYRVSASQTHKIMGYQILCKKKSVDNLFIALGKFVTKV
jgi:hypothetical protein